MTPALITDLTVCVLACIAMIGGWRLGAVSSVLSTIGVIAGLMLGAGLSTIAMRVTDQVALRILITLGLVLLFVAIGNIVGGILGAALRVNFRTRSAVRVDSFLGAVFQTSATLIVLWLISMPLAAGFGGSVAQGISGSHAMHLINRVTPYRLEQWPSKISAMLNESGLPPLVSPFADHPNPQVEAPRVNVENVELVEAMRPSVVHVVAEAEHCRRRLLGSGVVVEPDYVVTNAHVVAGSESVRLDTSIGTATANIVYYNPQVDIAVLYSPGLGLPALPWAQNPAQTGDEAIVMGFPQSGPFEAAPARIRSSLLISGPDIYAAGRVEREAYTVRGTIREGNSGGPMVNDYGEILGIVFGASIDQSDTGYVLTAKEVRSHIGDITTLRTEVGTQECVAQ